MIPALDPDLGFAFTFILDPYSDLVKAESEHPRDVMILTLDLDP